MFSYSVLLSFFHSRMNGNWMYHALHILHISYILRIRKYCYKIVSPNVHTNTINDSLNYVP